MIIQASFTSYYSETTQSIKQKWQYIARFHDRFAYGNTAEEAIFNIIRFLK